MGLVRSASKSTPEHALGAETSSTPARTLRCTSSTPARTLRCTLLVGLDTLELRSGVVGYLLVHLGVRWLAGLSNSLGRVVEVQLALDFLVSCELLAEINTQGA